jgi:hypothetical protein
MPVEYRYMLTKCPYVRSQLSNEKVGILPPTFRGDNLSLLAEERCSEFI